MLTRLPGLEWRTLRLPRRLSDGYRTVLVLSGGTQREDLVRYAYRPDLIVDSVADLCDDALLLAEATAASQSS